MAAGPDPLYKRIPPLIGVAFMYWLFVFALSFGLQHLPSFVLPFVVIAGLPIFGFAGAGIWRAARAGISDLAYRDDLTGLRNRRAFRHRITPMLDGVKMGATAMILIDVDDLKTLNDECGHQAGDEALVEVARHLRGVAPQPEAVYRIGGDEFAIVVNRISRESITSVITELQPVVSRLQSCGHDHDLHVSYGFASNRQNESFDSLFHRADERLREFKSRLYESGELNDRRSGVNRARVARREPLPETITSIEEHRRRFLGLGR